MNADKKTLCIHHYCTPSSERKSVSAAEGRCVRRLVAGGCTEHVDKLRVVTGVRDCSRKLPAIAAKHDFGKFGNP